MGDGVYRIEALRDQVVACLRGQKVYMTEGALALKLHVPLWAVLAGLEAAQLGGLVVFFAGYGYRLDEPVNSGVLA